MTLESIMKELGYFAFLDAILKITHFFWSDFSLFLETHNTTLNTKH